VHKYGKGRGPTLPLVEPTPDQASRSPTSTTNGATRYDELAGGVGYACASESGEPKLRSHRINKEEFDHREWGVRGLVG
jgi:hypothetical protein